MLPGSCKLISYHSNPFYRLLSSPLRTFIWSPGPDVRSVLALRVASRCTFLGKSQAKDRDDMSKKVLDLDLITAIREITEQFLSSGDGTPVHLAKAKLARKHKHDLLDEAARNKYVQEISSKYFPMLQALDLEDNRRQATVEHCITLVFKALKAIYERSGDKMCSGQEVLEASRSIDPNVIPECISVGMLFTTEFTTYVSSWNASPHSERLSLNLPTSSRLLNFQTLAGAKEQELKIKAGATKRSRSHSQVPKQKYGGWEIVEPLGGGGQSEVFLARSPARVAEREKCLQGVRASLDADKRADLATAIWSYARPESHTELGALKVFKMREGGAPAQERLKREIAVLRENRPNLPKLLDANDEDQWMVTEYFSGGTLEKSPLRYMGKPVLALKAFRTLVATVATALHKDGIVHRDIKPANVFIGSDGSLIPGDFGIVYLPDQAARPTVSDERVGPREYMPQWADLGLRLEQVKPNFDVYMLGKLLWCMVAGRLRLPREYHRWADYDLVTLFPKNKHMYLVNSILDRCLVERPDQCLSSATELLHIVDENLAMIEDGVPLRDKSGQLILPCSVCGKGFYQEERSQLRLHQVFDERNMPSNPIHLRIFTCNVCTHREFFAPGYPDEAAARDWKPWSPPRT